MRKLYYGERGCGKTTKLIEEACEVLKSGKPIIVLSQTTELAEQLANQILDKTESPHLIGVMDICTYVKYCSNKKNDDIVLIIDDIDAIIRDLLGWNFIASASVSDNFELQELEKHPSNIPTIDRTMVLNAIKECCFAPQDSVDLDFEKHIDEILNGTYVPLGLSTALYHHLLSKYKPMEK